MRIEGEILEETPDIVVGRDLVPIGQFNRQKRKTAWAVRGCKFLGTVLIVTFASIALVVQTGVLTDALSESEKVHGPKSTRMLAGDADGHSAESRVWLDSLLFDIAKKGGGE